jgi:phosphotransferase family enzyme
MDLGHGTEVWASPAWRTTTESWLDEQLAAAGIERTGEIEQPHLRPWATVLQAPTAHGPVWLKAAAPGTAFEVELYLLLQRVVPDHVLEPIAADVARGWIVLPDGGPSVGERLAGDELVDALEEILPQYGQLQRALAPHAGEMLALGVADMRPAIMPTRFDEALEAVGRYVEQHGDDDDRTAYRNVATLRGPVAAWCERLATMPAAPSLDHNDLHPWNILGDPGQARFYDWGDGVVAHPFASMLVALGFVQHNALGVPGDDPRMPRLRDAYLEPFSDLAPHAELVETLELACRVAKIARALTWNRAVSALGYDAVEETWARAPLETMASLLDDSHLGRT